MNSVLLLQLSDERFGISLARVAQPACNPLFDIFRWMFLPLAQASSEFSDVLAG